MSKIKLVGFDLDDCLYDSSGLSERARIKGIEAMIKVGLQIDFNKAKKIIQEIVKEYGSNSTKHYNYFVRRLNELEKEVPHITYADQIKYVTAAVMAYHDEKTTTIQLFEDVKPCLLKLKNLSIKTAIITDGLPIKQYEKILRLGLEELIDLVVISDEIGIRKPNPKLFDYCLKKFQLRGEETIYVGDRIEKDIIPALLNNIHSVYIHRGGKYDTHKTGLRIPEETKPEFEITDLNEIFAIIKELNK